MVKIVRPDYLLKMKDGSFFIQSKDFHELKYNMNQFHAVMLSLYDGIREEEEIYEIVKWVFTNKVKSIDFLVEVFQRDYARFLIPADKAKAIFPHMQEWPVYEPSYFLTKAKPYKKDVGKPPAPRVLSFYLTNNCTHQCEYCYAKVTRKKVVEEDTIGLDSIKKMINQGFQIGIEGILLTGGEPFLYPEIYNVIDYAAFLNIPVQILTKHLIDIEKLKTIDTSLLDLTFSIDSHEEVIANKITRSQNFYSDIMKNIKNLNESGIPFKINMTITKINKDKIIGSVKYFLSKGAKSISIKYFNEIDDQEINQRLALCGEEKEEIEKLIIANLLSDEFKSKIEYTGWHQEEIKDVVHLNCAAGNTRLVVGYNGQYVFCEMLQNNKTINLGNIFEKSLLEAWNSMELQQYKNPCKSLYEGTICYECSDFDSCKGKNSCIYVSYLQHGTFYRPNKEVENVCIKK